MRIGKIKLELFHNNQTSIIAKKKKNEKLFKFALVEENLDMLSYMAIGYPYSSKRFLFADDLKTWSFC